MLVIGIWDLFGICDLEFGVLEAFGAVWFFKELNGDQE
jgi:hypothetical protein